MVASYSSAAEAARAAAVAVAVAFQQLQPQQMFTEGEGAKLRHHAYSRKQKSLGLLCSNFVGLYNRDDVEYIGLDDAARRVGVERHQIYDIVNVLESIWIPVRKAKNRYSWIGFGGVPMALRELKEMASREKSGLAPLSVEEPSAVDMSDDEDDDKLVDPEVDTESEKLSQPVDNPSAPRCRLRSGIAA